MISYAQNFEDVFLDRIFKFMGVDKGTYVDIGAYDPDELSVTKHFYEKGWSGVNVEPSVTSYGKLVSTRQRDQNIHGLVSMFRGMVPFFDLADTGCSSISAAFAESAGEEKGKKVEEVRVYSHTLADIFSFAEIKPAHFLKVDVEGAEAEVLASNDWNLFRPIIVVYEAVQPDERPGTSDFKMRIDHSAEVLKEAGYIFLHFDGLNKFFVRKESWSQELADLTSYPVCVFDDFKAHTPFALSFFKLREEHESVVVEYEDRIKTLKNLLEEAQH